MVREENVQDLIMTVVSYTQRHIHIKTKTVLVESKSSKVERA